MHENPLNDQQTLFCCHHTTLCRSYWCDHGGTLIQSDTISTMCCLCNCKLADGAIRSFRIVYSNVFGLNTFVMTLLMYQSKIKYRDIKHGSTHCMNLLYFHKSQWNYDMFNQVWVTSKMQCLQKFLFSKLFNIIINQHCIKEKIKKINMFNMRMRCNI